MKKIMLIALLTAFAGIAAETRIERSSPPSPADKMPNSDSVPSTITLTTQFQRVVIARIKYQTDLLAGLQSAVKENQITNAVILSAIGSVRSYHFHGVNDRSFPVKDTFVKDPNSAADLVSMNGYVIGGRVHAHVTLANANKAFGGHLEPGTEVFTFAIVTLGVLDDKIDLSRFDDKTYR